MTCPTFLIGGGEGGGFVICSMKKDFFTFGNLAMTTTDVVGGKGVGDYPSLCATEGNEALLKREDNPLSLI
jgi:hypothetical protein